MSTTNEQKKKQVKNLLVSHIAVMIMKKKEEAEKAKIALELKNASNDKLH